MDAVKTCLLHKLHRSTNETDNVYSLSNVAYRRNVPAQLGAYTISSYQVIQEVVQLP